MSYLVVDQTGISTNWKSSCGKKIHNIYTWIRIIHTFIYAHYSLRTYKILPLEIHVDNHDPEADESVYYETLLHVDSGLKW